VALLVAASGFFLLLAGRALRSPGGGLAAGALYVLLATAALSQGDANAANTEWFVAFFTSGAAALFLSGGALASSRRVLGTGGLLGLAFLSKQPALLDAAAPALALLYSAWRQGRPARQWAPALLAFAAGWLAPGALAAGWFAAHGALRDAVFYTWTYNLDYYGAEISSAARAAGALRSFQLIGGSQPLLFVAWLGGATVVLHRLLQRQPTAAEETTNPGFLYLAIWSVTAWAGAASSGRDFDHYTIQFLAPFCLGAGLAVARLGAWAWSGATRRVARIAIALLLVVAGGQATGRALAARSRTLPDDPSRRVATYIREHSTPADRVFVWGFHPDIYLFSDRRPASRYLYGSFITGLIPWTNVAPDRDTTYAVVPGALETLLRDLAAHPPLFIVDCSAGPNRFWQKYPPDKFPAFATYLRDHYEVIEGQQFVSQGFRLLRRRPPGAGPAAEQPPSLPETTLRTLAVGTLGQPEVPVEGSAPFGVEFGVRDGHAEYFVHAPSRLVYRLDASVTALRGAFGIRPGAYAADNTGPTDGAEFLVRWTPEGGATETLLQRTLLPRQEAADRGLQSFRVVLPQRAGRLELVTSPGLSGNPASDWTFWSDLMLEKIH
jgi:hypothetical protein